MPALAMVLVLHRVITAFAYLLVCSGEHGETQLLMSPVLGSRVSFSLHVNVLYVLYYSQNLSCTINSFSVT
jgi:hypothetical protein